MRNIPINIPLHTYKQTYYTKSCVVICQLFRKSVTYNFILLFNSIISKIAMCNSTQVLLSWKYSSTLMSPADHWVLRLQCRNSILLIELSSPLVVWYRVHFAIGCLVLAPGRMVLSVTKNSYVTEIRAVVPVPVLICGVLFDLVSYQ